MSTLETVLLSLLVIDAFALIVLILVQQGKGADVGAAFGSGSSNTVLGSSGGGNLMTKITTWLAIAFFLIAFGLAYTAKERAAQANSLGIPQALENADVLPALDSTDRENPADEEPAGDIPGL
jgi:preprotein translocase subunit SecG